MSANDRSSRGPLTKRAVRVRNRCLTALAARRALPVPTETDISAIGDDVRLSEAWAQWQTGHTPATGIVESASAATKRPPPKWRSRTIRISAIAAAGLLGFVVGDRWLPGAGAQSGSLAAEQIWQPLTDSVVPALNDKLSRGAMRGGSVMVSLSAADLATLIFRSPRRRQTPVDSIEARIDSLLWIRGRLRGGTRFELAGEVGIVRRGLAEFRVRHLTIGGVNADSAHVARLVAGVRSRAADTDRMRFEVPAFVAEMAIMDGAAQLMTRERR